MSTRHTPDELAQHYTVTMGRELGGQFYRLWNECAWLHLKWSEYVALFGTEKARLELLNKAAPGFTRLLDGVLWDDILLHICRMTDEPTVGRRRRDTLTIRRLPLLVTGTPIEDQIKQLAHVADSKARFARDWRNRHIAHRDLRLALMDSNSSGGLRRFQQ
jgi:AbiU2